MHRIFQWRLVLLIPLTLSFPWAECSALAQTVRLSVTFCADEIGTRDVLKQGPEARQKAARYRLLVTEGVDASKPEKPTVCEAAGDAVYEELVREPDNRFELIDKQQVQAVRKRLGLMATDPEGKPMPLKEEEQRRLAQELHADFLLETAASFPPKQRRRKYVDIYLRFVEATSMLTLYRVLCYTDAKTLGQAITDAATAATQNCLQTWTGPIPLLRRSGNTIVLGCGLRNGVKIGQDMVVLHHGNSSESVASRLHVIDAYATEAEADIVAETGPIEMSDIAFLEWHPSVCRGCLPPKKRR